MVVKTNAWFVPYNQQQVKDDAYIRKKEKSKFGDLNIAWLRKEFNKYIIHPIKIKNKNHKVKSMFT